MFWFWIIFSTATYSLRKHRQLKSVYTKNRGDVWANPVRTPTYSFEKVSFCLSKHIVHYITKRIIISNIIHVFAELLVCFVAERYFVKNRLSAMKVTVQNGAKGRRWTSTNQQNTFDERVKWEKIPLFNYLTKSEIVMTFLPMNREHRFGYAHFGSKWELD